MTWVARSAPLLLALLVATTARADGAQQAAREAYDRGVQAHKRGDVGRAAEEFARADALAPSPVALGAALDAAVAANRPVLGMELVARAARAGADAPELQRSVEAAREAFAGKTGRLTVVCNDGAPCSAKLDGQELAPNVERVVLVGEHALVFRVGGSDEARRVQVGPDAAVEVHPSAAAVLPPPPPAVAASPPTAGSATPPKREASMPLSRVVVLAAGGVTVVVTAVAVVSALAAADDYGAFTEARCPEFAGADCTDLAASGKGHESRSNVLFVAAGVLGVATLGGALLWADWGDGRKGASVRLSPAVGPAGGGVGLRGTF